MVLHGMHFPLPFSVSLGISKLQLENKLTKEILAIVYKTTFLKLLEQIKRNPMFKKK